MGGNLMLKPSYGSLIQVLNKDAEADSKITSRYSIVIAAAKRARQIVAGYDHVEMPGTDKAVSLAVNELYHGHVKIVPKEGATPYDDHGHVVPNMPTLIDDSYVLADDIGVDADFDTVDADADDVDDDWDDEADADDDDEDEDE